MDTPTRPTLLARSTRAAGCLLAGCLLVATGCGEEPVPLGDGSLTVTWEVSPRGCEAAGVERVEVTLRNAHGDYAERVSCADGRIDFDRLAAASYELTVVGTDAGGQPTFGSEPSTVRIEPERHHEAPRQRLTALPATVSVSWRFDNGQVCGANDVDQVEVTVFDHAFYEVGRDTFDCNDGGGSLEGLTAGSYLVEAVAEGDEATWRGLTETELKRGETAEVDVLLEIE